MSDEPCTNGWQEYQGRTDVERMICPHCGNHDYEGPPTPAWKGRWDVRTCSVCLRSFVWHVFLTPLGLAWQTWDRDPRPQHAKGR